MPLRRRATMLLETWLTEQGLPPHHYRKFNLLSYFGFGDSGYYVEFHSLARHYDPDLERLLGVMESEAERQGDVTYRLCYGDVPGNTPTGNIRRRNTVDLIAIPVPLGDGPAPDTRIAEVRWLVTSFNLTGSWPVFDKPNL